MKRMLYLHGFGSSPHGEKITRLRAMLEPEGWSFIAPDLNVPSFERLEFASVVATASAAAEDSRPLDVIVGSSLGSLVALELAAEKVRGVPLVLIAPALGFGRRWTAKLPDDCDDFPFFHYGYGKEVTIHRRFFDEMRAISPERVAPEAAVAAVMGGEDETVPLTIVQEIWDEWAASGKLHEESRLIVIPGGDHSLTAHLDRIAAEIRRLAG